MMLGEPSSPVTTLSNHTSLLHGGLLVGEWDNPGWWPSHTIVGSQDFIPGAGARFWLSMDFMDGCRTWDPGGHVYDVLVMFFPSRVYTDSNYRDTLGYEWLLVHCYHLVVCLVVLMAWIRGCWKLLCLSWWLMYYFTYDIDFCQHSTCLCILQFIRASIIPSLIKMTKIMKAKDQLLVAVSLALQTLVSCMSKSQLFMTVEGSILLRFRCSCFALLI
jgi:hypothetical protein